MNIRIAFLLALICAIIVTNCIGGFIKIPKNINSLPIDRSYRALYDELTQKHSKDSIRIKQVSIFSQIENGLNFNFIFLIEDQITQNAFLGQSLIQFDNTSKKAELNGYSFLSYTNSEVNESKRGEIKASVERYFKGEFTFEKSFEFENILGYHFYLAYVKNAIGQKKYYVFSQQVDKQMEYEVEGVFIGNDDFKTFGDINDCCCLNEFSKWEVYAFGAEERKCPPEMKMCTVALNGELCKKG